jgi:hypothetical protein
MKKRVPSVGVKTRRSVKSLTLNEQKCQICGRPAGSDLRKHLETKHADDIIGTYEPEPSSFYLKSLSPSAGSNLPPENSLRGPPQGPP